MPHQGNGSGNRQVHGKSSDARAPLMADADGDQGCRQSPLPGLSGLPYWPLRTHSWGICRVSAEFCFQSIREPGPKIALDACLRHSPDLRDRKRRGLNLAAARLPPMKSLLCLQAPRSVPGADSSVFVINSVVNTGPVQKAATQPAACNFNGHFTPSLLINIM